MDVSQYIDLPASWIISLLFFFTLLFFNFHFVHSYRGRRNGVWNVRVKFCHKDIIAFGEQTSVAFLKLRTPIEKCPCRKLKVAGRRKKNPSPLIPYLSFLRSVLIFHCRVKGDAGVGLFGGGAGLRYRCVLAEYQMDRSLFFRVQMFVLREEKDLNLV